MKEKWNLRDWNLKAIGTLLGATITDNGKQGYWIRFGSNRGNKTYIAFDNGGELNIFGLGFSFENQAHSMVLPNAWKLTMSNEDVVAYRILCWIDDEEFSRNFESILDEGDIEAIS